MAVTRPGERRAAVGEVLLVAALHTFLALVATYPLIGAISSAVIGGGDTVQNAWNLWWVNRALHQGDWFPYFTEIIYHPTGVPLAYHTLSLVNGWVGAFLQSVLGFSLIQTYNLLILLTFVGTGVSTYLLVFSLTRSRTAALVGSLIFTFAPIRMSRVVFGNLNLFSTQLIPLALLFAIQMNRTGRWYYAVLAALMIGTTAGLDLFLAYGTGLFVLVLVLCHLAVLLWRGNWAQAKGDLGRALLFGLCTAALVFPFVWPMLESYTAFREQANPVTASVANSADFLGFWIPDAPTRPLLYRQLPAFYHSIEKVHTNFQGNLAEKSVFVGYTVLSLIVLALALGQARRFWPWAVAALVFFLLSLGPVLHAGGRALLHHLPYEWLATIPLLNFGRTPSRFALFMMLALAVIGGYAVAAMAAKRPHLRWVAGLLACAVFVEFLCVPIRVDQRFQQIPAYYASLSTGGGEEQTGVLDIPIDLVGAHGPAAEYMLYQTVHQRPIVSGYISRTPSDVLALFDRPFIHALRARIYGDDEPYAFDPELLSHAAADLAALDVGYVVLHRAPLSSEDHAVLYTALVTLLEQPDHEDARITVWEVSGPAR